MLKARASSLQSGVGLRSSAGVIKASQLGSAYQTSTGVRELKTERDALLLKRKKLEQQIKKVHE